VLCSQYKLVNGHLKRTAKNKDIQSSESALNLYNARMKNDLRRRSLEAVWHPCTQMKSHEEIPLLAVAKGDGVFLYDFDGKAYLDSISSWWTNLFGHANQTINLALKKQLDQIAHVMLAGVTHQPVVELSERLSGLTGHQLGHAFYASDGASAVEIALKMSFHYWRNHGQASKHRFICLANSYHGETVGALAVTDIPIFTDAYSLLTREPLIVPTPDVRQCPSHLTPEAFSVACLDELEATLQKSADSIAAIIVEPMVQCATGMAMYPASYLKGVRNLCNAYKVHLIADEIAVGCGRTGPFFACEHAGIWPDMLTLSKGISAGYLPLSVVLSSDEIYQAFYSDDKAKSFLHSHSFTGNPLACTAALASLDIFENTHYLDKNKNLTIALAQAFSWVQTDSRLEHLRQLGTILAFDVKATFYQPNFSKQFSMLALEKGLLIRPIGNVVYIMPPYVIEQDQITFLSETIQSCLAEVLQNE
jgi:adenosylmethionine---8-amino-7-oxononanoate aminotransferase